MITLTTAETLEAAGLDRRPLPTQEDLAFLHPGNQVQLRFESPELAERMWVVITAIEGGFLQGSLANEPFLLEDILALGDPVTFTLGHVLDVHH